MGIRENRVIAEQDMMGGLCQKCKKGNYKETSINDDRDGVLHCSKCNHESGRHRLGCAIRPCGRQGLTEPGPGLELFQGAYCCTLCYANPTRFKQPNFKKAYRPKQDKLAKPRRPGDATQEDLVDD
jgi:hypothetical protein